MAYFISYSRLYLLKEKGVENTKIDLDDTAAHIGSRELTPL